MDGLMGFMLLFGICFICYRIIRFTLFGLEPSKKEKDRIAQQQIDQQQMELKQLKNQRLACRQKIKNRSNRHKKELSLLRSQLIRKDEFGHYILSDWEKKVQYFLSNVVRIDDEIHYGVISFQEAFQIVDNIAIEGQKQLVNIPYSETMTGIQYEQLCGNILEKQGWQIKYTKKSGDQGVDIIAIRQSITLAVQCKRYKKPIGNKAIQEVVAGQQFYNATYALVIASNGFTKSAKQLAQKTNVLLLNHQPLEDINKLIK